VTRRAAQPTPTLHPDLLLAAYAQGAFPMAEGRRHAEILWFSPPVRAVLPLHAFHCPRSLRKLLRKNRFEIRRDTAFPDVIHACAQPRPGQPETWINAPIADCFIELHERGYAHSIEAWRDGELVGGLYGLAIGAAFFGESMFHRPGPGTDASKVCLAKTVEHLKQRGYDLFDVQFTNPHLERFGVTEIPRPQYLRQLRQAIAKPLTFAPDPNP